MTFINLKTSYTPGEDITCTAEGNPPATYSWTAVSSPVGDVVIQGSILRIERNMAGTGSDPDVNIWTCTAQNVVGDGTVHEVSKDVQFIVGMSELVNVTIEHGMKYFKDLKNN